MAIINSMKIPHDASSPGLRHTLLVGGSLLTFFILSVVAYGWLFAQGCNLSGGNGGPVRILIGVLAGGGLTILGGLIVLYKPQNRIGWLSLWLGCTSILTPLDLLIICGAEGIIHFPAIPYLAWMMYSFAIFAVLPLHVVFPMIFPTGRFLSPLWHRVTIIGLAAICVAGVIAGLSPDFTRMNAGGTVYALSNPFGMTWVTDELFSVVQSVNITLIVALTLTSIASLVLRFQRSSGDERQQIKWLVYFFATAGSLQPIIELIGFLGYAAVWDGPFYLIAVLALFLGFPVVTGITIFKYRLYDIDIIVNRTLVYGALTILVILLYTLTVNALGFFLQSQNTLPSSVIAMALITLVFQPARDRLQSTVNRLMFGDRDNPYAVLSRLGQKIQTTDVPSETLKVNCTPMSRQQNGEFISG
jgi:hypothetical protein